MLSFLPPTLRGVIAFILLVVNTLFWCCLLFVLSPLKYLLGRRLDPLLNRIATAWVACNSGWMALTQRTRWDVQGVDQLSGKDWYLVNANHQSWVDIFVLQHCLNRRIPLLKFFLKHELIYVPVIGLAWWALDFPFMKRHGRTELRRNPELRNQDRETARQACAKFARTPTSVMNFAEGTRFTADKHQTQASPYRHLLKPKSGALAMTLDVMGESFRSLLDATIVYPGGVPSFWQFLCGTAPEVVLRVQQQPIPPELLHGNYEQDSAFRRQFHRWVAAIWEAKDQQIEALLAERAGTAQGSA